MRNRRSSLSNYYWMDCRRYFAASRLEVLFDEDDFRSSSRALECGSFLLVSQLHVAIQTLWSQCLFPRAEWTVVHSRVSPFLIIEFWVLVGFVGSLCCFQRLLNPISSSNYLDKKSLEEVEVTHILSSFIISRFHHNNFRDTISWECVGKRWLHSILFDRTSILSVEQVVYRPRHRVLMSIPLFLLVPCKTWYVQVKLLRLNCDSYSWDS